MAAMYALVGDTGKHTAAHRAPTQRLPHGYLDAALPAADLPDMRLLVLAVGLLATGCHLRAGFDAASHANGPLQAAMASSSISRSDGVLNLPAQGGRNYALEAGFGNSTLTVNGVMVVHDVTSTSFTPGAGYLATTLGANVRWETYHWHHLSPTLAAGPARILLLDRNTGDRVWGNALRGATGLQLQLGPVAFYGDVYREIAVFRSGAASGSTTIDGVTLGLAIQP
jgi:hypothetical protein